EDFLLNVKQGHCERFAAGLALMLQSVGVPTRLVKGYRGAEHQENGVYHVLQSHAHSWVEALVERPTAGGKTERFWLTLDPTPATEALVDEGFSWARWWSEAWNDLGSFWKNFILDYNADQQTRALLELWQRLRRGQGLARAGMLLAAVGVLGVV